MALLKETFFELLQNYTADTELISKLWSEIEEQYSGKKKFYHTLQHLEHLLKVLIEVKSEIKNWNTVLFSMYYHDLIYNATKSDNEEQSAELAGKRLLQVGASADEIRNCKMQILATKKHLESMDSDTNYFTDADLSVLGQDWDVYADYFQNVRKEYSFYIDMVYIAGRKKVLKSFLAMDRIYKTDAFFKKYESRAKVNIYKELQSI